MGWTTWSSACLHSVFTLSFIILLFAFVSEELTFLKDFVYFYYIIDYFWMLIDLNSILCESWVNSSFGSTFGVLGWYHFNEMLNVK